MENEVYIYQGSLISVGQKFKMDIENNDAFCVVDVNNLQILIGHTLVNINQIDHMKLIRSSSLYGIMDENSYRDWYNKRLLDRNPTAPVLSIQSTESDTLTDFGGLGALGVRIQRH